MSSLFDVKVDTSALTSLQAAAGRVDVATKAGLTRVAEHAQGIEAMEAGKIYSRPIPTRAQVNAYGRRARRASAAGSRRPATPKNVGGKGTPAWTRSGDLLSKVKADPVFVGSNRVELRVDNAYGASREGLGADWKPKNPALGVVRKNTFARDTVTKIGPQVQPIFESEFMNALQSDS